MHVCDVCDVSVCPKQLGRIGSLLPPHGPSWRWNSDFKARQRASLPTGPGVYGLKACPMAVHSLHQHRLEYRWVLIVGSVGLSLSCARMEAGSSLSGDGEPHGHLVSQTQPHIRVQDLLEDLNQPSLPRTKLCPSSLLVAL